MEILLAFSIGVLVSLAAWWLFGRDGRTASPHADPTGKGRALHAQALETNLKNAVDDLNRFCKRNPKLQQPYLILGNLYRLQGEPQRSAVIHQNLLADTTLSKTMRDRTCIELANDLVALGVEERAVKILEEVFHRSPFYLTAQETIASIQQERRNFDLAFEAINNCLKKRKTATNRTRAGYLLALHAEQLLREEGDLPSAKKILGKALTFDRGCIFAMMLRSEIAMMEKHYDTAIDDLRNVVLARPEYSALAVPHIEEAFYAKQSFMRFGEMLSELQQQTGNANPYLDYALARHYRKRKMLKEARALLGTVIDHHPTFLPAIEESLVLSQEEDDPTGAARQFNELLAEMKTFHAFSCTYCHHTYDNMVWFCASCGRWETVVADHYLLLAREHDGKQSATASLPGSVAL